MNIFKYVFWHQISLVMLNDNLAQNWPDTVFRPQINGFIQQCRLVITSWIAESIILAQYINPDRVH